jgi:hypothetical protein
MIFLSIFFNIIFYFLFVIGLIEESIDRNISVLTLFSNVLSFVFCFNDLSEAEQMNQVLIMI